jgi:hypothetical protein
MSVIKRINSNIPRPVNKTSPVYQTIFGIDPFTPEVVILEPADYNCGAIANELEFLNAYGNYFVGSTMLDTAAGPELETLVAALLNLPRRGAVESDTVYRARFKSILAELTNPARTTKWAIRDALSYFVPIANIDVVEFFDIYNNYFQVRFNGAYDFESILFLDDPESGYLDQDYLGGVGIGSPVSYVGEIINRIKAGGVAYDVFLVTKTQIAKNVNARVGKVQIYKTTLADIKVLGVQFTKTVNARVV